jgi:hypothetical protein
MDVFPHTAAAAVVVVVVSVCVNWSQIDSKTAVLEARTEKFLLLLFSLHNRRHIIYFMLLLTSLFFLPPSHTQYHLRGHSRNDNLQIHAPSDTVNVEEHTSGRSFFTGLPADSAGDIRYGQRGAAGDAERATGATASHEAAAVELLRGLSLSQHVHPARR